MNMTVRIILSCRSHTCIELLTAGYGVVIADDLSNSEASVVDRIEKITGKRPAFYQN